MATLYIQEFASISTVGGPGINKVSVGSLPNVLAFNSVALTSSSQPSAQLNAKTQYVRLCSDTNCHIAFSQVTSTATTATTTSMYVPANLPEYLAVQGSGWIQATL